MWKEPGWQIVYCLLYSLPNIGPILGSSSSSLQRIYKTKKPNSRPLHPWILWHISAVFFCSSLLSSNVCLVCDILQFNFVGMYCTLIKNKIKFSLYLRKYRREQLQSHIWLTSSLYMVKYLRISSYIIGSPSSYMTLQPLPSEIFNIWGKFYFIFYQCTGDIKKRMVL